MHHKIIAMNEIIITSGTGFVDMDGVACAIAYQYLLRLLGQSSHVVIDVDLNHSVPEDILEQITADKLIVKSDTLPSAERRFIIVDISDSEHFPRFVDQNNILEVYDHRKGFIDEWKKRLGKQAHIEPVGACATLIFEEYQKLGFLSVMPSFFAKLLAYAIWDNTLGLKAQVTTERDITALNELEPKFELDKKWKETYFQAATKRIQMDLNASTINDTKKTTINIQPVYISQLEVWSFPQETLTGSFITEIKEALQATNTPWFLTIAQIETGTNIIVTDDANLRAQLTKAIGVTWTDNIGTTKELWLRKEIMEKLNEPE